MSSNVSAAPAICSPLTILVPPSRAHSASTARAGAFCATSVTRPPLNSIFTVCAAAGPAQTNSSAAERRKVMVRTGFLSSIRVEQLFADAAVVFDDGADNLVQPKRWLISDELAELRNVWHAPGHVFEPLFICFVIRDVTD